MNAHQGHNIASVLKEQINFLKVIFLGKMAGLSTNIGIEFGLSILQSIGWHSQDAIILRLYSD